jgi:hypothetical protein
MARKATATVIKINEDSISNAGSQTIGFSEPYVALVRICGVADYLYHRWDCDAVDAKAKSAKGSTAKKTDNIESYVYRMENGNLAIPGEQLRMAIVNAARFRQDPRSPRKSAVDLFKAGVITLTPLYDIGRKEWDYEHRCRVVIQRNAVTRVRPALRAGWEAEFQIQVNLPEYISSQDLNGVIANAGRLMGIGDFRPTYGRFQVVRFIEE